MREERGGFRGGRGYGHEQVRHTVERGGNIVSDETYGSGRGGGTTRVLGEDRGGARVGCAVDLECLAVS